MTAPTSFDGLIAWHARVAVELSGVDQTMWNGRLEATDNGVLGVAHWDGTLEFDREIVVEPLRDMYERPGARRPREVLARYREALLTLLHEQSHFLGPTGSTPEAARRAFKRAGSRALEEGVAEAWAQDNADRFLRRLGIPKVAPGITRVRTEPTYPEFVPAVRELVTGIGRQANLSPARVLAQLNRHSAATQWASATELVYRSSGLARLVPADAEAEVRSGLEELWRGRFAELDALVAFAPGSRGRAAAIGRSALKELQTELTRQEANWASGHATRTPIPIAAETGRLATPVTRRRDTREAINRALSGRPPATSATTLTSAVSPGNARGHHRGERPSRVGLPSGTARRAGGSGAVRDG